MLGFVVKTTSVLTVFCPYCEGMLKSNGILVIAYYKSIYLQQIMFKQRKNSEKRIKTLFFMEGVT